MKNLLLIPLIAFTMIFFSCSKKYATPMEAPGAQITFGSGGGFSGQVNEYVLLSNGQLFKKQGLKDEYTKLTKVKKALVDQIFQTYQSLDFNSIQSRENGNIYYYVSHKESDSEHKLMWSTVCPSQELLIYYNNLNALIPSNK